MRTKRTVAAIAVTVARLVGAACLIASLSFVLAPSAAAQPSNIPCGPAARACLDLSANQAWLADGGMATYGPVPVTHGRPGWETPPGVFNVTFKDADFWSTDFDAPMPYSVFFNGGIAFHEGSLSDLSHGCVHLSHAAATAFFDYLQPGDVVQVVP